MIRGSSRFEELMGLRQAPVAIAFRDSAPEGLERVSAAGPAGCSYWKRAAQGQSFYTEAADHANCPIGAHTHGVDLDEEQGKELEGLIGTMVDLGYLDPAEVAGIPRRQEPLRVVMYGPLTSDSFEPDVVLMSGTAQQMMLLSEAAHAAGVSSAPLAGRPTCAAIPEVMRTGQSVTNLGCVGNRVYTGLPPDELYFVLPSRHVDAVADKLATIVDANRELKKFHESRL